MERIESINAGRIHWCCQELGVTPLEMAAVVGVSPTRFENVLRGQGGLTYRQLKKLADYCSRGVLFFLESGPVPEHAILSPQFRTIANQKPQISPRIRSLVERVEHHRDIFVTLQEEQEERAAKFTPPDVSLGDVEGAAAITREWLGVSLHASYDFDDYRSLVEAKGILVFVSNPYAGKWKVAKDDSTIGFSVFDADHPVIFVVKQNFTSRQSFTLFHELGHVLLHKESSIDDLADLESYEGHERDANVFAAKFLIPDEAISSIDLRSKPNDPSLFSSWLKPMRRRLGVSNDSLLLRLVEARLVSQSEYDRFRSLPVPSLPEQDGGRRIRYREPRKILGDAYVRTVLTALYDERITLAKASTYLDNIRVSDLRMLEGAYAGI
jgi:Zn-dependent peptidase ImmA (M78 family)